MSESDSGSGSRNKHVEFQYVKTKYNGFDILKDENCLYKINDIERNLCVPKSKNFTAWRKLFAYKFKSDENHPEWVVRKKGKKETIGTWVKDKYIDEYLDWLNNGRHRQITPVLSSPSSVSPPTSEQTSSPELQTSERTFGPELQRRERTKFKKDGKYGLLIYYQEVDNNDFVEINIRRRRNDRYGSDAKLYDIIHNKKYVFYHVDEKEMIEVIRTAIIQGIRDHGINLELIRDTHQSRYKIPKKDLDNFIEYMDN
jgi:hypothetical protein